MNVKSENIEIYLGESHILKGIDINADTKDFIGIIGPNGSGKSTFLKCIYRILKPSSGIITLDNENITNMPIKKSAKKMAVVSQHNFYNFDFLVKDIVLMGRTPHKKLMERDNKEDYEIIYDCLEKVGMRNFADRSFSSLSGGEQQRIILARALAQKTNCMILDEPTNHLDIKYQLQLLDIVKNLDITIIAAIHDLNIAAMYCTKIYVMKDGKIIGVGEPKDILTKELIKDVYEVDCKITNDIDTNLINIIYKPSHV